MKFKIGDEVKIIKRLPNNQTGSINWNKPNGDVGKTGKITDIHIDAYKIDNEEYYYGYFRDEELELLEPTKLQEPDLLAEAKLRYPVETKVKCLCYSTEEIINSNLIWKDGNQDVIMQENQPYTRVYRKYDDIQWAEIVKPVEAAPTKPEPIMETKTKFKVGDSVRIVISGYGCSDKTVGQIVTIAEIGKYSGGIGYRIEETHLNTNSSPDSATSFHMGFIGEKSFELAVPMTVNTGVVHAGTGIARPHDSEVIWYDSSTTKPLTPEQSYKKEQSFDTPVLIKQFSTKRKLKVV